MTRKRLFFSLLAVASLAISVLLFFAQYERQGASLAVRLEQIVPVGKHLEVACADVAASHPLVLLALGQSNAGNHGAPSIKSAEMVTVVADGKCIKTADQLPAGTGSGGSIWQRLPALLATEKDTQPIVLSVLAVDASSIDDWTKAGSPLKQHLISHIATMHRLGLAPALVLWQHGEADSQMATTPDQYAVGLDRLATVLSEAKVMAPIILARSTICRADQNAAIRSAIESAVSSNSRFKMGPDTDTLSSNVFRKGCHLTTDGLASAAKMWATAINRHILTIWLP